MNNTFEPNSVKSTYIFEIDGALTSLNQPIDAQFIGWFERWMLKHDIYLYTHNTYENIFPRLGRKIIENSKAVFTCNGNSIWMTGKEAVVNNWRPSHDLISYLESLIKMSEFKFKSGPNFEYKTGMINFSVVGNSSSEEERKRYREWEKISKERKTFCQSIEKTFPNLYANKTNEISIDIGEKLYDTPQILQYFTKNNKPTFISTDTNKKLSEAIYNTHILEYNLQIVNSWQQTFDYLRKLRL
jgi:hypothetical protein